MWHLLLCCQELTGAVNRTPTLHPAHQDCTTVVDDPAPWLHHSIVAHPGWALLKPEAQCERLSYSTIGKHFVSESHKCEFAPQAVKPLLGHGCDVSFSSRGIGQRYLHRVVAQPLEQESHPEGSAFVVKQNILNAASPGQGM